MKYFFNYIFVFFFFFLFKYGSAQLSDTARKWTITECFNYAAAHNVVINTLRLSKQSALQNLSAAKGIKIPNLSASINNSMSDGNNDALGNGVYVNHLSNNGSYSINSSILLWNYNSVNNNIRQKDLLSQSSELSVQQSINNTTLSITQGYLAILLAKENLKYVTDLVTTSEGRVKQNQQFYDAGSIAKNSLLQLQAQLAGDEYLLVQTKNLIRQNILQLKQFLQLPADSLFEITTPDTIQIVDMLPSLNSVQQNAYQTFPEIKIGKTGIDIASLDIAKAKAGFTPSLFANGNLGTGYTDVITNSSKQKTNNFTQSQNNFYQNIGVTLSIPILSQRVNQTNLAKAKIGYRQANLNSENNQLILSQAIEQTYLNASNAQEAYVSAHEQLVAITETYRISNEQYKLGAINSYDLLQQRNQYIQAVQAFTEAKYTLVLQQKIYEFYMGKRIEL